MGSPKVTTCTSLTRSEKRLARELKKATRAEARLVKAAAKAATKAAKQQARVEAHAAKELAKAIAQGKSSSNGNNKNNNKSQTRFQPGRFRTRPSKDSLLAWVASLEHENMSKFAGIWHQRYSGKEFKTVLLDLVNKAGGSTKPSDLRKERHLPSKINQKASQICAEAGTQVRRERST